jgi:hypothetical protein
LWNAAPVAPSKNKQRPERLRMPFAAADFRAAKILFNSSVEKHVENHLPPQDNTPSLSGF